MKIDKESLIEINIKGINVKISYSEASRLIDEIRKKMFNCYEYKEEMKLVEKRLKEFEESNRQFPDELFYCKSERFFKLIDNHLNIWKYSNGDIMKEGTIVSENDFINGHTMSYWIEGQEKYWEVI